MIRRRAISFSGPLRWRVGAAPWRVGGAWQGWAPWVAAVLLMAGVFLPGPAVWAQAAGTPLLPSDPAWDDGPAAQAAYIERLYGEGDAYRAESEVLRFLQAYPADPRVPAVALLRAKLYYREGRYPDARLMLYALLDRHPQDPVTADARRLLTFTHLRLGEPAAAAQVAQEPPPLAGLALAGTGLAALDQDPPGTVDPGTAVAWSTWVPGSGYFLLGQPARAAAGVTLNLALLGATAYAVREDNLPAALLFLVFEAMLWQGGRSGVRQEAMAINARLRTEQLEGWLRTQGEGSLLGVGLSVRFGGG